MVTAVSSILPEFPALSEVTLFGNRVIRFTQAALTDIQKVYATIFYTAIFLIAWFFSRDAYLYYRSKAAICFRQVKHLDDYFTFGDRLIHSSINFRPHHAQYDPEVNLETIYGEANTQRWLQNNHLLEPNPLERYNACCFGISFDFLSKYLLALQNGSSLPQAIELASSDREEGATIEAELAQILMSRSLECIDQTEISAREWRRTWNRRMNRLSPQEADLINQMNNLPEERRLEFIRPHFQELYDSHQAIVLREIHEAAYTPVATLFGCRFEIPPSLQATPHPSIQSLEEGVYLLTLPAAISSEHSHAIVYIKTEEADFLFDPNFGTIKLNPNETADYFRELYKDPYSLEDLVALQVLPVE